MLATNFNNDQIDKINDVLDFILNNSNCSFYKKKYIELKLDRITSYADFQKIPLLKKNEFTELEKSNPCFIPKEDILFYSCSSGTSNDRPTMIPFSSYDHDKLSKTYFNEEFLKSRGVRTVLTILIQNSPPLLKILTLPNRKITIVTADPNNLDQAAYMAKKTNVQGIITTASRLFFLIPLLITNGFAFSNITWISLGSEFCTIQQMQYFRLHFPNAYFHVRYGGAEFGTSYGYRCVHLEKQSPQLFHPTPIIMETINEKGEALPVGEIGEFAYSHLEKHALPLIRYCSGDMGKLEKEKCACGNPFTFTMLGRKNTDFAYICNSSIHTQSIANGIEKVLPAKVIRFKFNINIATDSMPKINLELEIHNSKLKSETVAAKIAPHIILDDKTTIANHLKNGTLEKFSITFLKKFPTETGKAKHLQISYS